MKHELRRYQKRTMHKLPNVGRCCVIMPCGAGKTLIGCAYAERHREDRILIVVPRIDLARQWGRVVKEELGEEVGYIVGSTEADPEARIQVATVQAIMMRGIEVIPQRMILDELHHYEADTWRMLLTSEELSGVTVLGLTATPQRADGKGLERDFNTFINGASYSELIDNGYLVKGRLYVPIGGRPDGLAMNPVDAYKRLGEGSRCIVSFGRVDEAEEWARRFDANGVRAACIHAGTPHIERKAILRALETGLIQVVTNVYLMTEGLDIPEVRCVILARRFHFLGTYVQVVGRALRPAPNKQDAIFIDLTFASQYHGAPDADRDWDTTHDPIGSAPSGGGGGGEPSVDDYSMPVSGEGLVRIRHGALKPTDPDPTPIAVRPEQRNEAVEKALAQIDRHARRLRSRGQSAKSVLAWSIREKEKITGTSRKGGNGRKKAGNRDGRLRRAGNESART